MRLLDTETGQLVEKDPEKTTYAILSHTWDNEGEQTYKQLRSIQQRWSQSPQSCPSDPEVNGSSFSTCNRDATPLTSQVSTRGSPLTSSLTTIGRLTQSEVEALFHAFAASYGLASPTPAPTSSDPPAPSQERQSEQLPQSI